MLKRILLGITLITLGLLATACAKRIDQKITNIERIFMHEPVSYTIWTRDPGAKQDRELTFLHVESVKRFYDVAVDERPWAWVYGRKITGFAPVLHLELHLRSAKDVDGAGWNHGKFGRGTTNAVE